IYFALLTQYDINYYLTVRPPEFLVAVALGVIFLGSLIFLILRLASNWFFSLPLVLFENIQPSSALLLSRERTQNSQFKLIRWIASWALIILMLSAGISLLVIWVARLIVPEASGSLPLLTLMIGITLVFWLVSNLIVNLLGKTTFAVILFNLYRHYGGHSAIHMTQLGNEQNTLTKPGFRLTKKRLLLGGMLGIALSTVVGLSAMYGVEFEDRAQVIAHRGASATAPENTLAAVKQAIIDQADWVEIDVQETADGEVVVFHDSDFMKLANIDLKIWNATMEDLAQIDIGSHFDTRFNAERVPTLRQVLAASKGKIGVIIELKYYGHDQQLEQRVAEIVEAEQMQASIMIMSLQNDKVQKMKELRPEWQVGLLTSTAIGDLSNTDADFLAVNFGLAKRRFIQSVQHNDKQVFVWTVNDAPTMSRLIGRGVDGLITDQPEVARKVLQYRANMPPLGRLLLDLSEILGMPPELVQHQ
ncbi:MAG: glycerophosphodiester phosphodiesterase, partial [Gammaproteobacteria bacterium]